MFHSAGSEPGTDDDQATAGVGGSQYYVMTFGTARGESPAAQDRVDDAVVAIAGNILRVRMYEAADLLWRKRKSAVSYPNARGNPSQLTSATPAVLGERFHIGEAFFLPFSQPVSTLGFEVTSNRFVLGASPAATFFDQTRKPVGGFLCPSTAYPTRAMRG